MGTLSNSVRDLTIAAAALWNGATLPAAEPPAPATQQTGAREPAPAKEWSSAQVYKELGAVEARISSIDQFFKTHPEQRGEKSIWDTRRAEVERFSKDAEKQMDQTPSADLRRVLGSGLTAVNSSLALYLDHLSAKKTQPAPAATIPAAPGGLPAAASGELIIGTYDVGDMAGMQTAAAMFRTLLEGQHARNGTAPDAMQQRILQSLTDIESARNPRDLSEKLRPAATSLIAGLADQNSPEAKALRESLQKLKTENRPLRGGLGGGLRDQRPATPAPAGNAPSAPARKGGFGGGRTEQKTEVGQETVKDAATAWETAWKARVANSTQLNRFAREVNSFRDLVQDPEGLAQVRESAEKLLKSVPNDQPLLKEHLNSISKAASAEEILKSGFSALDELKKATDLYRGARPANPGK